MVLSDSEVAAKIKHIPSNKGVDGLIEVVGNDQTLTLATA